MIIYKRDKKELNDLANFKLTDAGNSLEYCEGRQTWFVDVSDTTATEQIIQAELAKIPSTAPENSLAEVLTADGLLVYMKSFANTWIQI